MEPSTNNIYNKIKALKAQKNAIILSHYYQIPEIQDIADYVGDSLGLAQQAAKTAADVIVFAGVMFMAETAKILNPKKLVVVPDNKAGCSLADNCPADKFREFIGQHPNHYVVTYVNTSAEVKALSDVLCTSSNAEKIINSIPSDKPIIFAPDQHLGRYLINKTKRDMLLWPGSCIVHVMFDEKELVRLQARHPSAKIIAHPECQKPILDHADHIGSTSSLLNFVKSCDAKEFIVATESGIIHQMQKSCPDKTFYSAPIDKECSCSECPFMRLNTLENLYACLRDEKPEVTVPEEIRLRALVPLERMLELS